MAAPVSPSRRVLADKSTNASVQYHGHDNNNKVTEMKPWVCTDMRNVPVTFDTEAEPKIGQKRSIVHVDGAEEREQDGLKKEVCEPVKEVKEKTEVKLKEDEDDAAISEGECRSVSKEEGDDAETEQKSEDSNATTGTKEEGDEAGTANNLLSSFHASQEGPLPHEEQFEIQDEVSQNTLETLVRGNAWLLTDLPVSLTCTQNKTQLPQNSSQPKTSTVSSSPMEGSQESIKMSSFINYDQTLVEEEWPARMIRQRDAQLDAEARQKMIDEVSYGIAVVRDIQAANMENSEQRN